MIEHNEAMRVKTDGPPPPRTDLAVVADLDVEVAHFPGVPDLMQATILHGPVRDDPPAC